MNIPYTFSFLSAWLMLSIAACGSSHQAEDKDTDTRVYVEAPAFDADSAYLYVKNQVDFGPRVPNTPAHVACGDYLIAQLERFGAKVYVQEARLSTYDGKMLNARNIIGAFKPESKKRIALFSHWDSRPWADNDIDEKNHHTPVMAANDGASGVAVMLEIARIIGDSIGIDFVCFDTEDYGSPQWSDNHDEKSWALGSQYFAQQYANGTSAIKGPWQGAILLDMVGGQGAHFYQEGLSVRYASQTVTDVWQAANTAGYGSLFIHEISGTITDDHKPLNEAGIPTIDIIPYYPDCEQSSFGPTWHTVNDDMQHIDKTTLKAVGQTLIQYFCSQN